jgi:hypothetical protein
MNLHFIPVILLIATTGLAHAEVFTCKDKNGRLFTSDQLIPECADQPIHVFGNNGVLRQEIPAPLTEAQRQQARDKAELNKKITAQKNSLRKEDQFLRVHFSSENDIEKKRKEELGVIHSSIVKEEKMVFSLTNTLEKTHREKLRLLQEDEQNKTDNPIPIEILIHKGIELEREIRAASQSIIDYHNQEVEINVKFNRYLNSFQEMRREENSENTKLSSP